jgi:hypothetical protein
VLLSICGEHLFILFVLFVLWLNVGEASVLPHLQLLLGSVNQINTDFHHNRKQLTRSALTRDRQLELELIKAHIEWHKGQWFGLRRVRACALKSERAMWF